MLLGSLGNWRRDLIGIIDWRLSELDRYGVPIHYNSYLDADDVRALNPDLVILATGGIPQTNFGAGSELALSTWDILNRQVKPATDILVYDGTGRHPAPLVAELAHLSGSKVTYSAIDGGLAQELTYAESTRWKKEFVRMGLRPNFEQRLIRIERDKNRLVAVLLNELTHDETSIITDQVVVEMGTIPMNELFEELRSGSGNDGVTNIDALLANKPQPRPHNGFELHRVGDAQSSRNIHAAILDSLRLVHVC